MKLSIILPTYNNEKTLDECLNAIFSQDFPRKDFEVLLIDGGSTDRTLKIAKEYPVRLMRNPKRFEEPARISGLKVAKGEIIALIDADNIIIGNDWFKKLLKPFDDPEIFCSDTLYFDYRKKDQMKVRYQALIGGDDPIATYLGFYSRWCYFKDNWTDFPYESEKKDGYEKIKIIDPKKVPSIGSNGFLIRGKILKKYIKDRWIHPDFICEMVRDGFVYIGKVNAGIVHNQPRFFPNKIRRIRRRLTKEIRIDYDYALTPWKIIWNTLWIITLLPLTYDVIKGFIKKPDSAWIFHYPASIGLTLIYAYYMTIGRLFYR